MVSVFDEPWRDTLRASLTDGPPITGNTTIYSVYKTIRILISSRNKTVILTITTASFLFICCFILFLVFTVLVRQSDQEIECSTVVGLAVVFHLAVAKQRPVVKSHKRAVLHLRVQSDQRVQILSFVERPGSPCHGQQKDEKRKS